MDGLLHQNEKEKSDVGSIASSADAIQALNDSPPVMKSKKPNSKEKIYQKKK
jgi:hypothetical protein